MLSPEVWAQSLWETLYMVIVSTAVSYLIGLPLGLLLVVTDKDGICPMPLINTVLGVIERRASERRPLTANCVEWVCHACRPP